MKRPELTTCFGTTDLPPEAVCAKLIELFSNRYSGVMRNYFAKVIFNGADECYEFVDEVSDLGGAHDLLARVSAERGGMWCMQINAGFLASDVYIAIYVAERSTNVVFSMDSYVTEFIEDEDVARRPYVNFLAIIAEAIDSGWFLSGLYFDSWLPLARTNFVSRQSAMHFLPKGALIYVVGWRDGRLLDKVVSEGWKVSEQDFAISLNGYKAIVLLPN